MKILKIISILLFVGGIAATGLSAFAYFNNEDQAHAEQYSVEQTKLLTEAAQARGTPREGKLMKEYEEGKAVTDLAWRHARQTRQTIMIIALGGLALMVVGVGILIVARKRSSALAV